MSHRIATSLVAFLLICTACTRDRVYDHYNHTPIAGWEKIDTLTYNVPPLAHSGKYGMELGLRTNNAFPFISLTLIVEQTIYPSQETRRDTVECKLIDKAGASNGKGVSYYQYQFPVNEQFLQQDDSLYITIRHDMQREILPGISDVGINIRYLSYQ